MILIFGRSKSQTWDKFNIQLPFGTWRDADDAVTSVELPSSNDFWIVNHNGGGGGSSCGADDSDEDGIGIAARSAAFKFQEIIVLTLLIGPAKGRPSCVLWIVTGACTATIKSLPLPVMPSPSVACVANAAWTLRVDGSDDDDDGELFKF
jgi:hypothetical protein